MRLRFVLPAALASLMVAVPAFAQAEGPSERTLGTTADGKRIVSLVIYGNDPCPTGKDNEIVVCAREPERERYRLPKPFRKPDGTAPEKSWGDRAASLNDVGKGGIGSCSPVGPGGATGCNRQMMRQAKQAKKQEKTDQAEVDNEVANQP